MEILLLAAFLGIISAAIAAKRGRNAFGWWIFGAALFIVALPLVLILPALNQKKCPECAESVALEATKCRYCGHVFGSVSSRDRGVALTVCPECNFAWQGYERSCPKCSTPISVPRGA